MKLKLGKMTADELAAWFGISKKTYMNQRKRKFELLELFADFEVVRGGVIIKEIYNEEYNPSVFSNYGKIKDKIPEYWPPNTPDTSKNVSERIQQELQLPLTKGTVYSYTNKGKVELYGKPFQQEGTLGYCYALWCKLDDNDGHIIPFTPEEQEIKDKLLKKYFGNANEREVIVEEMIQAGEIKKEEAWDIVRELSGLNEERYGLFRCELEEAIGYKTGRATVLQNGHREPVGIAKEEDMVFWE